MRARSPASFRNTITSSMRKGESVEMIVTTSKDAVRIPPECLEERLWVLEVELAERPGAPPFSEELQWLLTAKART